MKRRDCTLRSPQVLSIYPGIRWNIPGLSPFHSVATTAAFYRWWLMFDTHGPQCFLCFFFLRYLTQVFQTELVVTFTHNLLIDPRSVLFSWRSKLMNLKRVNILGNWWQPVWKPDFFFWWLSKLQMFVLLQISAWMVLSISLQPLSHNYCPCQVSS